MATPLYDRLMTERNVRRYYDDSGFFNFGYWTAETNSQRAASEALVDQLVQRLPNEHGRILDVACGLGASSQRLAKTFAPEMITGINISEQQIAHARARCPDSHFAVVDATNLQFPEAHFDAVICVEAAFHFDTRARFFREAFRVLKPGGALVVSDILFRALPRKFAEWSNVPPANLVRTIKDYSTQLAGAGFVKIDIEDATDVCLTQFCRNLVRWPFAKYQSRRMNWPRAIGSTFLCAAIAAYFKLTCKSYLLVSARKPNDA